MTDQDILDVAPYRDSWNYTHFIAHRRDGARREI
jgi:hypothetical protein